MKFVFQYVAGFLVFAGAFVAVGVFEEWNSWVIIAGVLLVLFFTVLKFMWDLSGFNGGYSS